MSAGALLGGCGTAGGPALGQGISLPSTTPTVAPSPACGGFHLDITNLTAQTVLVRLNGRDSMTVTSHEIGAVIYQYGPGGVSDMPWHVDIVDPATGTLLVTREVSEASGDGAATITITPPADGSAALVADVTPGKGC